MWSQILTSSRNFLFYILAVSESNSIYKFLATCNLLLWILQLLQLLSSVHDFSQLPRAASSSSSTKSPSYVEILMHKHLSNEAKNMPVMPLRSHVATAPEARRRALCAAVKVTAAMTSGMRFELKTE
ncbi:hypothetical protein AAHA92_23415 [Salvia divinorum]|uniref:Uncharacterized protein n=1 Tax=Salvia divinorum TaxID=28513 RepID=A0ABD1GRW1_SALDI